MGPPRLQHLRTDIRIALDELGYMAVIDPGQVMQDEDLAGGCVAGPDPDRRAGHGDDHLRHRLRHRFDDHRETAGLIERDRVPGYLDRPFGGPALAFATEGGRSAGESDMTHHRDSGVDDRLCALTEVLPPSELDRIAAGF